MASVQRPLDERGSRAELDCSQHGTHGQHEDCRYLDRQGHRDDEPRGRDDTANPDQIQRATGHRPKHARTRHEDRLPLKARVVRT